MAAARRPRSTARRSTRPPSSRSPRSASSPAASTSRSDGSARRSRSRTSADLDFLPNDKAPVVAFIGLREGAERALFSVSSDVAETKGDGSCAPKKPAPCQFLTLEVGDERRFKFADGRTYRLKLLATHVVRIPDPRRSGSDGGQNGDPHAGDG